MLVAACSGSGASAAADCERIPGVRNGLCVIPAEDRVEAPTDQMPQLGDDGGTLSLTDYRGEVLVLNFWASWCGPCRTEQPDLNDAYETLSDEGVDFLGVNIEESRQTNGLAHEREFDIPYPSMYDPGNDLAAGFEGGGPRIPPSTLFLDEDGRVAARVAGTIGTTEVIGLAREIALESGEQGAAQNAGEGANG